MFLNCLKLGMSSIHFESLATLLMLKTKTIEHNLYILYIYHTKRIYVNHFPSHLTRQKMVKRSVPKSELMALGDVFDVAYLMKFYM